MTTTYFDAYMGKCKKQKTEFEAKWNGGDFWMTSQEALDWGWITSIKDPVKIDQTTASAIRACGSPLDVTVDNPNNNKQMDLKLMAVSVGLPETATEEQVRAKMQENADKAGKYDVLKAQVEQQTKEKKAADIKAKLDAAEKDKRIKADTRPKWQAMLEANFENGCELIDSLQPVVKMSAGIVTTTSTGTYEGKTFEQLQDENPAALEALEDENPEAYAALFADWKKRNKIK